ncbi:MAG TPA: polysaccharide deacetylase family protein [Cytophagaceae bacterium]
MLNFRTINICFATATVILAFSSMHYPAIAWGIVVLLILYVSLVAYGSSTIQSGFFLKAICSGEENTNSFCLTFDDGPNKQITPLLLDLLKEANIKVGFFCIGKNIAGNESILNRMHQEGHTIGNHTYGHSYFFDFYRKQSVAEELMKAETKIEQTIGKRTRLFRPPYGVTNPAIRDATKSLDYTNIGWNIRSLDTVIKSEEKIIKKITSSLKSGSIVLLHDTDLKVLDIVKGLILYSKQNNLSIVSPHKLLNIEPYR